MKIAFFTGPDLPGTDEELAALVNAGLDVQVVRNATRRDVLSADYCEIDVLWFAAHGGKNEDGEPALQLADGWLPASTLAALVKAFSLSHVYLNSCDSIDIAMQMIADTEAAIVCSIAKPTDEVAVTAGTLFARRFAFHGDFAKAYQETKAVANHSYRFLGNINGSATMTVTGRDTTTKQLDDILRAILGDQFTGSPGLMAQVASINRRLDTMHAESMQMAQQNKDALTHLETRLTTLEHEVRGYDEARTMTLTRRTGLTLILLLITASLTALLVTVISRFV